MPAAELRELVASAPVPGAGRSEPGADQPGDEQALDLVGPHGQAAGMQGALRLGAAVEGAIPTVDYSLGSSAYTIAVELAAWPA